MAVPDIVKGSYVDILIGDGATPEVFTPLCGLTARNFTHQVNTNDQFIPDCALPESIPHRRLVPTGEQWDLAGEGLLNLAQTALINAATGVTKNYRFRVARPAGSIVGTGYWQGPAMLTNKNVGGTVDNGEFASVSLAIASDGAWAFTPAA